MKPDLLTVCADQIVRRAILDALTQAEPLHWLRRARAFEDARPKPTDAEDYTADVAERDRRCAETAEACRQHALIVADADPGRFDALFDRLHSIPV